MRAVAVRCVFGLLTGAEHDRPVFVGGEAQRSDARGFCPVSSVTERLSEEKKKVDTQTALTCSWVIKAIILFKLLFFRVINYLYTSHASSV